ncbi:helix-turn-helix transcriptional regulator [Streptomyces sp. NPDC007346]|uniref:helix-turn-helix transcriptional regulator n=1 Tax=Streptomyces sp. NPDC007346 TaxID=3154682 RepID=UPI00345299AC
MPPVFAHGRLRLYLLKLLDEAPRHGYEVIRLLEERFQGLYAPSAGTVYPRLAKLEAEGLVTHATEGGRKVYSITDAGRAELAGRSGELADLELEIRDSLAELAAEIRDDVRGAAGRLRSDVRAATSDSRQGTGGDGAKDSAGDGVEGGAEDGAEERKSSSPFGDFGDFGDSEAWRNAKEELRRAKQEWKEQARRAKDESRRAREEAQQARRQAKEAQDRAREQMQNAARQVQEHFARGDWPSGVREGLAEITGQLGGFARSGGWTSFGKPWPAGPGTADSEAAEAPGSDAPSDWGSDVPVTGDPARDLDRLLDRFRDTVRDTARDHGVTEDQLAEARGHLGAAAARIEALLTPEGAEDAGGAEDTKGPGKR